MVSNDIAAQTCCDGEKIEARAMLGYQSTWMAHWMLSSCKSATNRLRIDCEDKEFKKDSGAEQHDLLGPSEVGIDGSMHTGASGEAATATRATASINEADTGKSKKASFDSKSFPILNLSRDGRLPLQREQNGVRHVEDENFETEVCTGVSDVSRNRDGTPKTGLPSTSAHFPPKTGTLVRECRVLSQEVLPTALLMKSSWNAEQKKTTVPTSLWHDFVNPASDIVHKGHGKGKAVMPQFTHEPSEIYPSSYNLASQERFTSTKYHSYSSLVIHEKKMSSLLHAQRSSFSRWIQGGNACIPHDHIAGSDDKLYFVGGQLHEIENYAANTSITNQVASLESTKPQNFCGVSSAIAQVPLPCSVHDMETMKIYTSIDSVEESSRGRPKISQTTQHFLMSKDTDVNLSDRGQFLRQSMAPPEFRGNACSEILDFSPPTNDCAREGLKLEAAGNSIKTEGKENVLDFKCPTSVRNESSADTDTMDIDALHQKSLPGYVPLQTNKCSKDSQNSLRSQVAVTSASEKAMAKSVNTAVPDINIEAIEALTQECPVVDKETSKSRTHSLDLEHLLSHADEHSRSSSGNNCLGPDPSCRWVKRLKLSKLGSTHGTVSTKIGENSSHEKVSTFGKIMKDSKTSSEPKMMYVEGQMVSDLPATVLTNSKSSLNEAKKAVELTLLHPWIQRWGHNSAASSQKRHEVADLHELKSSGTLPEEFQKKQFPSIGAMALMGKAMNSLNSSELMKKGPVIVWNAKGF